jgi:hypothetical protein
MRFVYVLTALTLVSTFAFAGVATADPADCEGKYVDAHAHTVFDADACVNTKRFVQDLEQKDPVLDPHVHADEDGIGVSA